MLTTLHIGFCLEKDIYKLIRLFYKENMYSWTKGLFPYELLGSLAVDRCIFATIVNNNMETMQMPILEIPPAILNDRERLNR